MKKIYMLLLIACLVYSCLPQKKTREILEKEGDFTKEEIIIADSCLPMPILTYKLNGYLFVDTIGYAPQNEQMVVYDKKERLLAMAARASELTYFCYFKYLYDCKGNHIGFSTLRVEPNDYPFMEDTILPFADRTYDINSLYYDLVERKYNNRRVERYHFVWDSQGNIVKVHDPVTGKKLEAPVGKKIVYQLKEGEYFWTSDIKGGDYHLLFYIVPRDNTDIKSDTIVYEGYELYVKNDWD